LEQHDVIRLRGEVLTFSLLAHRAEQFLPGLFPWHVENSFDSR